MALASSISSGSLSRKARAASGQVEKENQYES
jgi:hypothetical protein